MGVDGDGGWGAELGVGEGLVVEGSSGFRVIPEGTNYPLHVGGNGDRRCSIR
jgi:hypothetical protein